MVAYLDSSVLLEHILKGDAGISQALHCDRIISSELLEVECRRVLHRYRLQGKLNDIGYVHATERLDRVLGAVSLLRLSSRVTQKSGQAFPTIIRTLDALHLSSAAVYLEENPNESILFFSYDNQLNRCARALGHTVQFSTGVTE